MARFHREVEGDDGWSGWVNPTPRYKFACCDCGLVHNMEFEIDDGQIIFRAQRNVRSTAQVRRHMKRKPE